MTDLRGTLESVGLPAILRFLTGLKKTGCLRVTHADWHGEVFFEDGRVIDASFGSRTGLDVLDALVQALPTGAFEFDASWRPETGSTMHVSQDVLEAHLDELESRGAPASSRLPHVDAVPTLVAEHELGDGDEQLSLDRGTLQTLLAVDGQRTVRAIVAQRGSFDALWQLGNLIEAGLVRLPATQGSSAAATAAEVTSRSSAAAEAAARSNGAGQVAARANGAGAGQVAALSNEAAEVTPRWSDAGQVAARSSGAAEGTPRSNDADQVAARSNDVAAEVTPAVSPPSAAPGRGEGISRLRPFVPAETESPRPAPGACPKLGFEDDPSNSFGRPTRLHRCFAAGRPLPLSMDQQRDLCLNEQFATCPRLAAAGMAPPPAQAAGQGADVTPIGPDDSRIVRWPYAGRARTAGRATASPADRATGGEPTAGTPDRARVRPGSAAFRDSAIARPTPLRAGMERPQASPSATAVLEPPATPTGDAAHAEPHPAPDPSVRRFGGVPLPLVGGAAVVVIVLAAAGYLLAPRLGPLLADDTLDPGRLPNTSAVAAGTPVAQVATPRLAAESGAVAQYAPAISPTRAPGTPASAVSQPTSQVQPTAASTPSVTLLDQRFTSDAAGWPNDSQGTAWLSDGVYHVATRRASQFVAVSAPVAEVPPNVIVNATFRKVGGPAGGGYGIIVRDQGPAAQDGVSQAGRYYVLEVGDKGEVGVWRRETDRWVDLLPWQHSDAVKPGTASNELTVGAIGNTLRLIVNGVQVAMRTDAAYSSGRVGLFVGGDGNQVALDRFVLQAP